MYCTVDSSGKLTVERPLMIDTSINVMEAYQNGNEFEAEEDRDDVKETHVQWDFDDLLSKEDEKSVKKQ